MKRSLLLVLVLPLSLHAQMIRGRVVDADAKPIAGAQVQVILAERSAFDFQHAPVVKTGEDGRYEMAAPPFAETERATLAVTLPAHATVRSKPFHVVAADLTVGVALPRFETVTVRVAARDGKPLPKARVAFAASADTVSLRTPATLLTEHFASRNVPTNDDGDAVLHLLPGTWDFAAVAEDFQPATLSEHVIKRAAAIAMTLDPAVTIRGRVHRNGTGVAGAQVVILQGEQRSRDDRPTITDADGAFAVRGLSPGAYRVSVTHEEQMVRRVIETKAPATLDVALPAAGTLRSRIIDADTHQPVREFFYSIEALDSPGANRHERGAGAEDGTITNTLTAGTYRVLAGAQGYTMTRPAEVRVTANETAELTIALDRGITVTGRIADETGTPVADAAIFVESVEMRERRVGPGHGQSAGDGSFTISGIEPGNLSLVVRKDGFVPLRKPLSLDATTNVDVQLTRGLSLEGLVRRGGKPAANVQISAESAALGGAQQSAKSDASGRFVLHGLVPARYSIAAYTDDANTQVHDVDPTKTRELVLLLDPKPTGVLYGTVTGIPTNLGGKITRRVVFVQGLEGGTEGMIDDTGNYRIEDAPTGTVFVTAQLESISAGHSSVRKTIDVVPGQSQRIDLDLGGVYTVRGRITHDGKQVAGVRVVFANETGLAGSASSRADGAYEVALPSAGEYQIFAHSPRLTTGSLQLLREIRGGETIDIELREQPVEGTVLDAATRQPLAGARVTLAPVNAHAEWTSGEVITDSNGRFRLLSAATGPHRLVAWTRGYAQRAQVLNLGNTPPTPVALELSATNDLRIHVLDAKTGTPLGAHITLSTPHRTFLPVRCDQDQDGMTVLCSLAPGKYRLKVTVHGYKNREVEVTAPGRVEVLME